MEQERPLVISIAGYDPSGGAGVLADVKTFEQLHCQGLAALSALTVQTPATVISVNWLSLAQILAQVTPLLAACRVGTVKIGLVRDMPLLAALLEALHALKPGLRLVWDPVLQSSSGFTLFELPGRDEIAAVLSRMTLLTPNAGEACALSATADPFHAAASLSRHTAVLLKGGHLEASRGTDYLFQDGELRATFLPGETRLWPKHGSGCIFSSAVAAGLARGLDLQNACSTAKHYTEKRLASHPGLLAYHDE
ncbi:hydroxymethylpyrimidine/phosphomethylpyrimidine kinase [Pedobacter yulinensis]|uniref:hydroxymethylpyrimidine kinase n=1 Tax=Pedobacter yulinensis TaxID=2126353 RepID=A0A2T3HKU9_9SPHI|nr:hydroxymethylpyrimidine/phosphomethylpyrimidine kinase [Pedobacter yulinensis]PST83054.1 hydroxymethylpyrimidine/phosphomethylpyrimidine kinase [Pedobacter yulinensis]